MKRAIYFFIILVLASSQLIAQEINLDDLIGTWKVDLRPTPDAEPYFQTLKITSVDLETTSFEGSFYYDSKMIHTAINDDWGSIVIAFVTQDNSGFYNSTARLEDGKLVGTTHSIGRKFVALWTAEKTK